MDPKREKPSRTPMNCSSVMHQLMEKMRSADECSPAEMCQRIMASFRTTSEDVAPTTPEEQARDADDEPRHGCCGKQPGRAPKGT